ncbi:MAG: hypothetical protein INR71_06925 [Terriglobus roseus]|nr:hypothetical protein [Terriglobus roseus]
MPGNAGNTFNDVPPGCTAYDYGELSLPFTPENTRAVSSIRDFLSEGEIAKVKEIETVYYSPVFQTVGGTFIPGLRSYSTSFCLYLRRYEEIDYHDLLRKFMSAVCMGHPHLNPDTVHWDWFRVTTPSKNQYYPLDFHGDLDAWINRMIDVATEKRTMMGWFDEGKFCLNDGSKIAFNDLRIDRLKGGEEIPGDW